jgi:energy-coupling factor transporter ATP-binding protein EcfA2
MELTAAKQTFKKVSDIEVPEKLFQTIKTDSPELDSVLSEIGGLVPSQVVLVTGNPGSGKTTLCAVVGSRVAERDKRPVVFLSYEMSDFQLKLQAKKIPGFDSLLVSTHEFHAQPGGIDMLFEALESLNPSMLIVDSLQKMASKMSDGPTRGQIVLVERFTKWAKKTFTPIMLIGHNDKGGNYSGPSFLKHEVDSHMTVWFDQEIRERLFSMSKNRFGGNMESYSFRITADGVFIGSEWWNLVDSQTPDEVRDMVMEYKGSSSGENLNWDKFKDTAETLISYLNRKHAEKFPTHTFIGSVDKVKLTWEGKRACCYFKTGQINFGKKFFDKVTDKSWEWVGYRSERPFIHTHVKNKEEAALWVILHEWVHLFKGYQHHTKKMWKEISRIAVEESWLWSTPTNA